MWRDYNVTTVKKIGDRYKISNLNMIHGGDPEQDRREWGESGVRLPNNVVRARTAVKELAMCNDWQWFVTLTLNRDLHDGYDLKAYNKRLDQFIRDQNKRRDLADKITYILVPERHKDGAWHMHGLLGGLREADLYRNEYGYLGWKPYERSFGFLSLGSIRDRDRCITYVSKYISKSLAVDVAESGAHLYYRSRGLKEPELIFSGQAEYKGAWDWTHPEGFSRVSYARHMENVRIIDEIEQLYAYDEQDGRAEV